MASTRGPAFALRAVMVLTLVLFSILGAWNVVAMHAVVFLITLPLLLLARDDESYYWLDFGVMLLFLASLLITMWIPWPEHHTLYSFDKILHFAGGAWVAAFAWVGLRPRITDRLALYIAVIAVAVAVGAFWEVFEWILSVLPPPLWMESTGLADSMMDLIADTAGAATALLAFPRYL